MKKSIGLIAILLALLLSVIYRHLTGSQAKEKPKHAFVPASLREELVIYTLLIQ